MSSSRFSSIFSPAIPLICALGATILSAALMPLKASAQSRLPVCPPPAAQEYLLLVRGKTEAERNDIASALPAANTVLICQYLDEVLVRAGGFTSLETANAWATYMTTVEGYESFVSKPTEQNAQVGAATSIAATPIASSANETTVDASAYRPLRLGTGYAVLVDYGDRPEIASIVSQIARPVGLAVYQGRAYLLADYTSDSASAETTLQRLSDAQTTAILVDAQQVVRVISEVARF